MQFYYQDWQEEIPFGLCDVSGNHNVRGAARNNQRQKRRKPHRGPPPLSFPACKDKKVLMKIKKKKSPEQKTRRTLGYSSHQTTPTELQPVTLTWSKSTQSQVTSPTPSEMTRKMAVIFQKFRSSPVNYSLPWTLTSSPTIENKSFSTAIKETTCEEKTYRDSHTLSCANNRHKASFRFKSSSLLP